MRIQIMGPRNLQRLLETRQNRLKRAAPLSV